MLDGRHRPSDQRRDSYTHVQKMRAAMTYTFGRTLGLGSQAWQRNELTGKMTGNPSVCQSVLSYMMSLRNRKVCWSDMDVCLGIVELICHNRFALEKQQLVPVLFPL